MWGDLARKAAALLGRETTEADPDSGPPPPAAMTNEAIEAWVAEHLDISNWVYCYPSHQGVCLAGRIQPAAEFQIPMRLGLFRTQKDTRGQPARSMIMTLQVDAEAGCFRLAETSSFRQNDLEDLTWRQEADPGGWVSLNREHDPFFSHVRRLCHEGLGGRASEGPASGLRSDIGAWVARTVQPGTDIFAYTDAIGATYVEAGSVSTSPKGYVLTLRIEFFELVDGTRSETIPVELDLRRRRMRQIEVRRFLEHNLAGPGEPPQRLNRWIDTRGTFLPEEFDRLCEIAEAEAGPPLP